MTDGPSPTIGRIVFFVPAVDPSYSEDAGNYHLAAIITMTPQEWTPGYRAADGTWVATTGVTQPKAGCVHLHVFAPPTADGEVWQGPVDVADVPYGELKEGQAVNAMPGVWYWPPRV